MITFEELRPLQKSAFTTAVDLIKSKKGHMTINGPAGTGKTTLVKFIIRHLIKTGESGIILAAPTHQAKKVLSKLSGMNASTIQSILKIHPSTYEENIVFEQRDVPDLAKCRILICDEISMYDRKLFDILMNTIPSWCTVIGLGDDAQIRPVAMDSQGNGQKSPFFYDPRFLQVTLEDNMRSNLPILDVANDIRLGKGWLRESIGEDGNGVHAFQNPGSAFRDFMINYFDIVKSPDDLYNNRMCAYTNKSVDTLNSIIRKKLYKATDPFIVGEVLVMQEPLTTELKLDGKTFYEIIFNNGQLVRVISARETSTFLKARGISGEYLVRYWDLTVETNDSDDVYAKEQIRVFSEENEINKFNFFLAKVANGYKSGSVKPYWKDFWKTKRSFTKVKALPASTIHKTQGISVDNCFMYTPCIHRADPELAQQLLYVGATRARNNLYFV